MAKYRSTSGKNCRSSAQTCSGALSRRSVRMVSQRPVLAEPVRGAAGLAGGVEDHVRGCLPRADFIRRNQGAVTDGSIGAGAAEAQLESGATEFLPLDLDELDAFTRTAAEVDKARPVGPFERSARVDVVTDVQRSGDGQQLSWVQQHIAGCVPGLPVPIVADDDEPLHATDDCRAHPFSLLEAVQACNRHSLRWRT